MRTAAVRHGRSPHTAVSDGETAGQLRASNGSLGADARALWTVMRSRFASLGRARRPTPITPKGGPLATIAAPRTQWIAAGKLEVTLDADLFASLRARDRGLLASSLLRSGPADNRSGTGNAGSAPRYARGPAFAAQEPPSMPHPSRSGAPSGLIVHSEHPFNAEPPLDRLRADFITPRGAFYVRSHGDIPTLDADTHRLRIDGCVTTALSLSLAELRQRFATETVTAVMQCAGNRRADLQQVKPTTGDPWAPGAIGNAEWTGVRLCDLLRAAGAVEDRAFHVALEACDMVTVPDEGRFRFGVSIPMAKALTADVLVAWAMNGEALAPEHGFPLRAVVPGYAGVRSAKWLAAITVQDRPSDNHMQQRDYKLLPPDVTAADVRWERGVTINDMPLNAAICEPAPLSRLSAGPVAVRGYAVATGRAVTRVDVSADGGRHWRQADLAARPDAPWSWLFWNITIDLARGEHELVVRAWDSAGQTQPASPDDTWNFKGYLSAAWHRVRVVAV